MRSITFLTSNGVDIDKSLELFGTIDTYNDTVGELLISVDEKLVKLEEYKNKKDMHHYGIYSHSLKSDARYFGFSKLADIAREHEVKSKDGDLFYIYNNFQNLVDEINKTKKIIQDYLSGSSDDDNSFEVNNSAGDIEVSYSDTSSDSLATVFDKKTILVADDSSIIRNFVKRIFSDNYEVASAEDGQEAIDLIKANEKNDNIVALLLDLNMPIMDGFAVLDYLQKNKLFKKIPVSIISGDSSKETIDKAFTYNIIDMLGKPFNDSDIKRVVEKTIYFKEIN